MMTHSYGRRVDGELVDLRTPHENGRAHLARRAPAGATGGPKTDPKVAQTDDDREAVIRAYANQIHAAGRELEDAARHFGKSLYKASPEDHAECSAKYAAAVARFAVTTNSAIEVLGQALHDAGAEVVFHG